MVIELKWKKDLSLEEQLKIWSLMPNATLLFWLVIDLKIKKKKIILR
jgi:hypothetical protein